MKKLMIKYLCLIGILLFGSVIMATSCQALSCKVQMTSPSSSYTKGDEVSVAVGISSLQPGKGVIALGAILDYDKDVLELKDVAGENKWSIKLGEKKTKIIGFSSEKVTKGEEVMKLTFLVKEDTALKSTSVSIENFEVSDGSDEITADTSTLSLTILDKEVLPPKGEDNKDNGNSSGSSTTKPNTPSDNIKPGDTTDKPAVTEKPDDGKTDEEKNDTSEEEKPSGDKEKEPDEGKEEKNDSSKTDGDKQSVSQNKTYMWIVVMLVGVIIVIVLAIVNQIIRRKK